MLSQSFTQKVEVPLVLIIQIRLTTQKTHGGRPGSKEIVEVTVEEAGNLAIRRL